MLFIRIRDSTKIFVDIFSLCQSIVAHFARKHYDDMLFGSEAPSQLTRFP
jgi:hypothetical protein